jgi:hypothetical protein
MKQPTGVIFGAIIATDDDDDNNHKGNLEAMQTGRVLGVEVIYLQIPVV